MYLLKYWIALSVLILSWSANAAMVTFEKDHAASTDPVEIGSSFFLDLIGLEFDNGDLDGGGVNIYFDTNYLSVVSVAVNTTDWEFFTMAGVVDNINGSITGLLFNSFESRTGSLDFATVEFMILDTVGETEITISEYAGNPFATSGSHYPNLEFQSYVQAVPVPAAAWLFGSAVMSLVGLRRSQR